MTTGPLARYVRDSKETRPPSPHKATRSAVTDELAALDRQAEEDALAALDWRSITEARQDLSAALDSTVALLKVMPDKVEGKECFRLELYWRHRILVTDDPAMLMRQGKPGFVLADDLRRATSAKAFMDCCERLFAWSQTKYELTQWLTVLRREIGSRLRLVVWDDTDFGIPWELFWHDMPGASEWLGVAVQVIRWTTVHDASRHAQFSAVECQPVGDDILYYEDPSLTGMNTSIHFPRSLPGYLSAQTMEDLLIHLSEPSHYGMVYVRGHGEHAHHVFDARLAGVRLSDLARRKLSALGDSRSVVFLNACNSATPVFDRTLNDASNRNFAEVFLHSGASAVIATLAEVEAGHSAALARALVRDARGPGVSVPEFLRARREFYANRMRDENVGPTRRADRTGAFLYSSVFAYFGHPNSVFQLVGEEGGGP